MPYQNDMSTLADVVSPAYAAQQAGMQNDLANQEELAKAQVATSTVPAEIQKPYLGNLFTAAQTANEQGLAQQEQAKGAVAQAGVPSATEAEVAGNQTKVTSAHVDQLQQLGQIVGQLDTQMQGVQGPARAAMVGQFLDSNGVKDPGIRQLMLNAAQQEGGLTQVSQSLFNASDKARQTVLGENIRGGYQLGTAQICAQGRLASAEATAQARVQVANITAQMRQQMQTFEQAAVQAQKQGNPQLAQQYTQAALQLRQAQANLNSQLLFGQQLNNPMAGNTPEVPQGGGNAPAASQGGNQPPAVEDAVTTEMKRRGLLK